MLRSAAVTRIQDGLGFSTRQGDKIVLRLQEAQRELEKGKTLPPFLLQENQTLALLINTSTVARPAGFLRIDDAFKPYFIPVGETRASFLSIKRDFTDALEANFSDELTGPRVLVVRNTRIDFVYNSDANYTIIWQYYKAADSLATDIENAWLLNAPDWLIGEAGWRMAMDLRDKDAVVVFDNLRKTGRAAVFGEIVAAEEASGPLIMGANL